MHNADLTLLTSQTKVRDDDTVVLLVVMFIYIYIYSVPYDSRAVSMHVHHMARIV